MNKGIIRKSLISSLSIVLLILIVPFSIIKAENNTYSIISSGSCNSIFKRKTDGYTYKRGFSKDVRGVVLKSGNQYYVEFVLDESFMISATSSFDIEAACSVPNINSLTYSYNGNTYYYNQINSSVSGFDLLIDLPVIEYSGNNIVEDAIRYTYGDLSVGPTLVDYGRIKDLSFYTNYISQPNTNKNITMSYNQDVIRWDNAVSDNGTQYNNNFEIEIHAERFKYVAPTISELMTKTLQDMNVLPDSEIDLGSFSALKGNKEFTWKDIAAQFLGTSNVYTFFDQLSPVFDNVENIYTMYGWYYKVRLINEVDNYEGEWQIVYNMTTLPETSDSIITNYYVNYNYTYSYEVDNSINTINEMNGSNSMYFLNNEVVNINYNDYTSNITNTTNKIDNQYNNMHEIEISLFNELDNKLQDFELKDFDTDIDNSFVSSLNWVNQQFNSALNGGNNPLGQFVYIVVSIGIVLLIVGILV